MKLLRSVSLGICLLLCLQFFGSTAQASVDNVAVIPPGSDVMFGYFFVESSLERDYVQAWTQGGVSTVRVARRTPLPNLVEVDEATGEGLLIISSDRKTARIDANLPRFGHLLISFRWSGNGLVFAATGETPTFSYDLASPSGQLTTSQYSWEGSMGGLKFDYVQSAIFGRDTTGVAYCSVI